MTAGVPSALAEPPISAALERDLAELTGTQRALLARSTLHAFCDLFGSLAGETSSIHIDAGAYPIARWGAERAAAKGVPVRTFAHSDPEALNRQLRAAGGRYPLLPLVVADGLCPGCGGAAPAAEYLEILRPHGGRLVLDDTQALGIVGRSPSPCAPYGRGGGGTLQQAGIADPGVLLVGSLAKGFGAPLAMVGGCRAMIARLKTEGETRVHCSPPSFADLHAAERALRLNGTQ